MKANYYFFKQKFSLRKWKYLFKKTLYLCEKYWYFLGAQLTVPIVCKLMIYFA